MEIDDAQKIPSDKMDTLYTLKPIFCILKVFALDSSARVNGALQHSCSFIRASVTLFILSLINYLCLFFKTKSIYNEMTLTVKITDAVTMVFDGVIYSVSLVVAYEFGKKYFTEYYHNYERIDRIICKTDYLQLRKDNVKLLTTFVLMWSVESGYDFVAWNLSFEIRITALYVISYIYRAIQMLNIVDFAAHVIQIEHRLKLLGDIMQDHYNKADRLQESSEMLGDIIENRNWFYNKEFKQTNKLFAPNVATSITVKTNSRNKYHDVKWLSRCYLLLIEQVDFIARLHGIRTLLNCLSLLFEMVRFTNTGFTLLFGTQSTQYEAGLWPVLTCVLRDIVCVLILYLLIRICEHAYQQCDRIVSIIDLLLLNKNSDELRTSLTELRELVLSRPVRLHASNFFTLDYSFLLSIVSVSVTYSIILLQSNYK